MSDQSSTAPAGEQNNEQGQEQGKEFTAITSQADFDAAIQARIARERAKFADYDDVKAKADRLVEIENAQKTEAQKQADKLDEIQRENAELKSGKLRAEVAAAKGVPAALLSGSTQAELEAAAEALIAFKGEQQAQRLHIPGEGKSPTTTGTPADEFADFLTNQLGQQPA